jgi:hypothetical protein
MAHTKTPRADGLQLARIARLALGGLIIGSFCGVYAGAVLGLCYAAWTGDLSPALDGALLGGAASALLGGGYGIVLGLTERREGAVGRSDEKPLLPGASLPVIRSLPPNQSPPAGHLAPDRTPEMEHAHVR